MLFYEAPHKLVKTLVDLRDAFGPERRIALCREMTKLHEEVIRTTLGEAAEMYGEENPPRGEFVLVIEGAPEDSGELYTAESALVLVNEYRAQGREPEGGLPYGGRGHRLQEKRALTTWL